MEFRHLKVAACPICGCTDAVEDSLGTSSWRGGEVRVHCNGQRWEKRLFACGYTTEWIPNYSRAMEQSPCRRDTKRVERVAQRKAAVQKVIAYITKNVTGDAYLRRQLIDEVKSVNVEIGLTKEDIEGKPRERNAWE